jgi:hypothetical protein
LTGFFEKISIPLYKISTTTKIYRRKEKGVKVIKLIVGNSWRQWAEFHAHRLPAAARQGQWL